MICWLGEVEAWVKTASLNGLLVAVVVLVADQHHRALAQRRHRLVRRVGLVDAQPGLARIGDQPRVEHARVLGVEVRAELLLLREVALAGTPGRRTPPRDRRARPSPCAADRSGDQRAKPNHASSHRKIRSGLIARHSSITRARVVDVAVEGAVGQRRPSCTRVEPARGLEVEQRLLDRAQRHRAVHRVLRPSGRPRRSSGCAPASTMP